MSRFVDRQVRLRCLRLLVAATTYPFCPLSGQADVPAVFVHGISSSAATWNLSSIITSQYRVYAIKPDLPSTRRYGEQADSLVTIAGPYVGSGLIGIGHSNGGIITREARRKGLYYVSIATVGTPHQGAPLAESVRNGSVDTWAGNAQYMLVSPWLQAPQPTNNVWRYILQRYTYSASSWINVMTLSRRVLTNSWDVLDQMRPGSAFLQDSLGRPDASGSPEALIPNRVSIQVSAPSATTGIIFSGIRPSFRSEAIVARTAMIASYSLMGAYYAALDRGPSHPMHSQYVSASTRFVAGAAYMLSWDRQWCALIGAASYTSFSLGQNGCVASDGVVPVSRQFWNGANHIPVQAEGHQAETNNVTVLQLLGQWGVGAANVGVR